MATDALRSQVASKWQESFNRLNRNVPGISGLLNFSEVDGCSVYECTVIETASFRHGTYPFDIYILEISGYPLRWDPSMYTDINAEFLSGRPWSPSRSKGLQRREPEQEAACVAWKLPWWVLHYSVPLLPHTNTDDVRRNFFLVEEDINEYMSRYDVRFPPVI